MTTDKTPAYYVAWSEAFRVVDYWAPLQTRGVGKTPEDAILHAERVCVNWYDRHTVPAGRGHEEWKKHLDTIHVWAVYHVRDVYPDVLKEKDDDPLGMTSVELPGLVVRGLVRSLYPGIGNTDEKKEEQQ